MSALFDLYGNMNSGEMVIYVCIWPWAPWNSKQQLLDFKSLFMVLMALKKDEKNWLYFYPWNMNSAKQFYFLILYLSMTHADQVFSQAG